ncbi:hypothetical protein JD844_019971 [Phrynosoma platyrhinos]|uniref:Cytochrome P450 3A n=1 Tax=Phrynosoma platyrhinos TaxID=52577 RepID=A0ABQ7TQB4_PHRPL|nr:hypothetical protein JD844_019971 [Phrynosoma platyrhinos]
MHSSLLFANRFSKENKETLDPYIYLPFGAGPRNCIGMRFALLVLKVAIVVLLQKYSFQSCRETPVLFCFIDMGSGLMVSSKSWAFQDLHHTLSLGLPWPIARFYDGRVAQIGVTDPDIIKMVLVKECYSVFTNRRTFGPTGKMEKGVFFAQEEQWKRIRTVLTPAFTSGKLKEMLPIVQHCAKNLITCLLEKAEKGEPVEIKEVIGPYSMDVATSSSFGVSMDSMNNPQDPFVKEAKKLVTINFMSPLNTVICIFPWLIPILNKINVSMFDTDAVEYFSKAILKIKAKREQGHEKGRVDFLGVMIESQKTEAKPKSNDTDHTYKDIPKFYISLQKAPLVYDTIMQMEYLDMAISEILRMYPIGGRIERLCKKDIEINGITIPKGVTVMIPPHVLHFDPEIWEEPEEFRPERFSKENKENINPYTYLPFGAGPRNCIGMRFALLILKAGMASLLQNFTFRPCKETQIPLEMSPTGIVTPKKPIILKVVPRASSAE